MKRLKIKIPSIPEEEQTPFVKELLAVIEQQLAIIQQQSEEIQQLKDEIAHLKKQKTKPKISPSQLEKNRKAKEGLSGKRAGSEKRDKTAQLKIDQTLDIAPHDLPKGSKFIEFQEYVVQEIEIQTHTILYRLERWQRPDGSFIVGKLPVSVQHSHFGPKLMSFILYQYYHGHVTQPLLLE